MIDTATGMTEKRGIYSNLYAVRPVTDTIHT